MAHFRPTIDEVWPSWQFHNQLLGVTCASEFKRNFQREVPCKIIGRQCYYAEHLYNYRM